MPVAREMRVAGHWRIPLYRDSLRYWYPQTAAIKANIKPGQPGSVHGVVPIRLMMVVAVSRESARKKIQAKPTKAALHFQLAQSLVQLSRVPEAIQALETGLRLAPEDPAARRLLDQIRRP